MSELLNDQGQVGCAICKKFFTIITSGHLKKDHMMTMVEYRTKYPDAPLAGEIFSAKQHGRYNDMFSNTPYPEDSITDSKPKIIKETQIKANDDPKEKIEIQALKENYYGVHEDKVRILNFLKNFFPNLVNNYILGKISLGGSLEYRICMDIADPTKKLDFEFPTTFWHNVGFPDKHYREQRLQDCGWKIISFTRGTSNPEIEYILKELKLLK